MNIYDINPIVSGSQRHCRNVLFAVSHDLFCSRDVETELKRVVFVGHVTGEPFVEYNSFYLTKMHIFICVKRFK